MAFATGLRNMEISRMKSVEVKPTDMSEVV